MQTKYKEDFIHAGKLAGEVRAFGKALIQKGASYNEVLAKINEKIFSLGAIPAFPPQIALNDVAAHFLLSPGQEIIFNDEVVKLDVGVCYKGAIGDCACTVDLSGKNETLIRAAEEALLAAEKSVEVGRPIREIGKIIEETATRFGLRPIKNLSGHGLGYYKIHTPPCIPNYDHGSPGVIKPGMTFAIEPFVTNGKGQIYEEGEPTIFAFVTNRKVKSAVAKKLLERIKTFQGLPFSIHNLLMPEFSIPTVQQALKDLVQGGLLTGYGPLIEEEHGLVAQAENSILVDEKGGVLVTTRI